MELQVFFLRQGGLLQGIGDKFGLFFETLNVLLTPGVDARSGGSCFTE